MIKRKPKNMKALAAVAAGLLAFAAFGYLVVLSPQRSRAQELSEEIAATEQRIAAARIASRQKPIAPRVDELFRLTKAMPDQTDMPGMLLELSRIAAETGIQFDSISPSEAVNATSYRTQPVNLVFRGSFYELSDFLFRVRNLVAVREGRLDVGGRLYGIDSLEFTTSEEAGDLQARVTAKAFVYGIDPAATAATPAPAPAPTTGATG